jgi:hypothetical protein
MHEVGDDKESFVLRTHERHVVGARLRRRYGAQIANPLPFDPGTSHAQRCMDEGAYNCSEPE